GSRGTALYPIHDPILGKRYQRMQVEIDEDLLQKIASMTGGKYFRAVDKESLEQVFSEIGELEKTKIEVKEYTRYEELFPFYLILGLSFLGLELILSNTILKKIP
ncbi:MAG: aerotolerance regulator BatA, partial [Candidatus Aminicenantes bacterium]|nr:aerotolerance regulator BatA [Candidatus Aminicenantes bacterium]